MVFSPKSPFLFKKLIIISFIILFCVSPFLIILKVKATDISTLDSLTWYNTPVFSRPEVVNLPSVTYGGNLNIGNSTQNMTIFQIPSSNVFAFKYTFTIVFSYGGSGGVYQQLLFVDNLYNSGFRQLSGTPQVKSVLILSPTVYSGSLFTIAYGTIYQVSIREIFNLTANTATQNMTFYTNGYLDNPSYIISSSQVVASFGGFLNNMFTLEWTGGGGDSASISAQNVYRVTPEILYQYDIKPNPISIIPNVFNATTGIYRDVIYLYQGTVYTYEGFIYTNSSLNYNGSFTVQSTGLSLVSTSTNYVPVLTGTIINGYFAFNFAPRSNPNSPIYENILINWTVTLTSGDQYYSLGWFIPVNQIENPNNNNTFAQTGLSLWVVLFLIVIVPALLMGFWFGRNGFITGLAMGSSLGVISGLAPVWLIFITGISIFLLLYNNNIGGLRDRI